MLRLLNRCYLCKIPRQISALKFCLNCVREKSYYSVLEIDSKASAKDIKSAYYKLSMQFHPDKNKGSPDSIAKFREISEAYEVLGNPEKRKIYDQKGTFQSQLYGNQSYNNGYYYRPRSYGGPRPFTGRTKDFNYDEHFRKHYEDDSYRQAEYEYFKRRWEAEFNRRYPNAEDYFRRQAETREAYEEVRLRFKSRRRQFVLFFTVWIVLVIINFLSNSLDPERKYRRVYYEIKDEDRITDD